MTLTPALLRWLQTEEAAAWLAPLTASPPTDAELLATLMRLRRLLPAEQAAALVEETHLRRDAATKFPAAKRMFFARTLLEQASPSAVAAHTARRFDGRPWVADLGCGLGGDTLALSAVAHVLAVDIDPLALALTQANAQALGAGDRVRTLRADTRHPAWRLPAAWVDPGRRAGDRRLFDPDRLQPPLGVLLELQRTRIPDMGIKLMPGLPHAEIPQDAEAEWISLGGDLKEAVLWLGGLARAGRRGATILPENAEIVAAGTQAHRRPPGGWLYEPDPAVIRAGAVGDLAVQLGLWQIDTEIAYLCGDELKLTPFARVWPVIEHLPFDLKALNRRLQALEGEVVAVKKRGSPIEPEAFRRRLSGRPGGRPLVVVITRQDGKPWTLICGTPISEESYV